MKPIEFENKMSGLVRNERKITSEILRMINLSFDRKHDLEMGFSSLFDWLTKGHGYSESAAQRRIGAAKLLRAVPEISEKIESGDVNLTTLSRAQTFLSAQEKASGEEVSLDDKAKLLQLIEKKTARETESVLTSLLAEASTVLAEASSLRNLDLLLREGLSGEGLQDLERVKELLSHVIPDGDTQTVIEYLLKDFLKRKDPLRKPSAGTAKPCVKKPMSSSGDGKANSNRKSVTLSAQTRRFVLQKAQGRCEYRHPLTGRTCGSRYQIQADHIQPQALGGSDEPENLRALCGQHNRYRAEKTFGRWRSQSKIASEPPRLSLGYENE